MTQEQIEKVNGIANKLAKELWRSEHLECFGNLEIKLQEIVKNLTIPDVGESDCVHCGGSGELAGGLVGCHYCGNY